MEDKQLAMYPIISLTRRHPQIVTTLNKRHANVGSEQNKFSTGYIGICCTVVVVITVINTNVPLTCAI